MSSTYGHSLRRQYAPSAPTESVPPLTAHSIDSINSSSKIKAVIHKAGLRFSSCSSLISNSITYWVPLHERTTLLVYLIMIVLIFTSIMVAIVNKGYEFVYNKLNKPSISPSTEIVMSSWAISFFLLGFATYRARVCASKSENRTFIGITDTFFILLISVFTLWLITFYGLSQFNIALILSIIQLIITIIAVGLFYQISKIAAISMIPIVVWLCYIVYLNFQIVRLNP